MAKLFNKIAKGLSLKNAPSTGRSGGGGGGAINRDPKAIQVKRVGYQINETAGGGGGDNFEGPQVDFEIIETAILRDSYINQAMMKYSELIFKEGYHFDFVNEQAMEYLKMRLEFMSVATLTPTESLFQGIADDIVRYGNCFLVKARAKGGVGIPPGLTVVAVPPAKDPVAGYFRLPPQTMEISRDENGNVTKYKQEVEGGGDALEFAPHDIVHIKVNVPPGRPFGLPWVAPVLEDVRLLRKVEENAALLLYRHIFPLLAYTVGLPEKGYEASDEELDELRSIIDQMPTDGAIILPERHKIEAVKVEGIDGHPYLEYFENRVFTGLGMSQVDMGRGNTANRNTADAMSGIKTDRIKGWQHSLQIQIDKFIIEELLVEGGFDPLINPEFDVDFVFNEIEQEKRIAKESHTLNKFNNNAITFEEMRLELGEEPVVDENRLHFQMIGMVQAEHEAALKNKVQPANQHGSRQGPKSKTESLEESLFNQMPSSRFEELNKHMRSAFKEMESDAMSVIKAHIEKKTFPIKEPNQILSSVHFGKDKMLRHIQQSTKYALSEGVARARKDTGRNSYPEVNYDSSMRVIKDYAKESLDSMESKIKTLLSERLENANNGQESLLAVKGIFSALEYRVDLMSKVLMAKSYNFGYALACIKYEEDFVKSTYEGDCPTCLQKAQEKISLKQFSSLDEIAIFYRIPPWHPNCECPLELDKGGES